MRARPRVFSRIARCWRTTATSPSWKNAGAAFRASISWTATPRSRARRRPTWWGGDTIFSLKLALKIDVATLRGTRDGVPRLVEILKRHQAGATFLFTLGPDRSGLHGKLAPAPQLGRRCGAAMR